MTRGDRQALVELALLDKQECIVYDVERILGVLDSPEGYGARVAYLRISMSSEEQIAYFASRENALEGIITKNTEHMQSLASQLENLKEGQRHVAHSMDLIARAHDITIEPLRAFDPLAMGEIISDLAHPPVLADIIPATILFTHRLVCFELPPRLIGRFRQEQIYIQKAAAALSEPTFSPPAPAEVPALAGCGKTREFGDDFRVHRLDARYGCDRGAIGMHRIGVFAPLGGIGAEFGHGYAAAPNSLGRRTRL